MYSTFVHTKLGWVLATNAWQRSNSSSQWGKGHAIFGKTPGTHVSQNCLIVTNYLECLVPGVPRAWLMQVGSSTKSQLSTWGFTMFLYLHYTAHPAWVSLDVPFQ